MSEMLCQYVSFKLSKSNEKTSELRKVGHVVTEQEQLREVDIWK